MFQSTPGRKRLPLWAQHPGGGAGADTASGSHPSGLPTPSLVPGPPGLSSATSSQHGPLCWPPWPAMVGPGGQTTRSAWPDGWGQRPAGREAEQVARGREGSCPGRLLTAAPRVNDLPEPKLPPARPAGHAPAEVSQGPAPVHFLPLERLPGEEVPPAHSFKPFPALLTGRTPVTAAAPPFPGRHADPRVEKRTDRVVYWNATGAKTEY